MPAISKILKLNRTQYELDFIDIYPDKDLPLFLDPFFISNRSDSLSQRASACIQSFFQLLIQLMHQKKLIQAKSIFIHLNEPSDTCLGLSKHGTDGKGIGRINSDDIFNSLLNSKAVQTGLVEDLEDCRIFVDGIDKDKISDLTTNLIRKELIEYTTQQCQLHNIPLITAPTGFYWDRQKKVWQNDYAQRLIVNKKLILLVPKAMASFKLEYTPTNYHQHFVLNFLQNEHLMMGSNFVQMRVSKTGEVEKYVTKKDLKENVAKFSKDFLREFTEKHPEVFKDFKDKAKKGLASPKNSSLGAYNLAKLISFFIDRLKKIPAGTKNATEYHRLMVGILELLFYPNLICPHIEKEIHDGRKRIDILFDNAAESGFFYQLHTTHKIPSQYVFVECKNYTSDPQNVMPPAVKTLF